MSKWFLAATLLVSTAAFAASPQVIETFSPWTRVNNLGAIVNTAAGDSCVFVTESGLSLYFGSGRGGGAGSLDLYVSQRATIDDPWGAPKNLGATLNTTGADHLPFITPGGHMMIFASDRASSGVNDLYVSYRRNVLDDFAWEAPLPIAELNSAADDLAPWGYVDGTTGALVLFFGSDRTGGAGGYDIYTSTLQADGKFSTPLLVQELSTPDADTMPTISQDGLEMYLTSNRAGGKGSVDIWTATRSTTAEKWSAPVNVSELNTTSGEQRAGVFGGRTHVLFFSSRTGTLGGADLYEATRTRTMLVPVVGSTSGVAGQAYKTSGHLANARATEISGRLLFHPAGTSAGGSDPLINYRLAAYETKTFDDLMGAFGVTGIGSLEIVPDTDAAPAVSFSIESGEDAVGVPVVESQDVLIAGSRGVIAAPSDPARFRVNVGLRTLGSGVTLAADLYDSSGKLVRGSTRTLPANYFIQTAAADLVQGSVSAGQSIVLTVQTGSAIVYASKPSNNGKGSTLELVRRIAQ